MIHIIIIIIITGMKTESHDTVFEVTETEEEEDMEVESENDVTVIEVTEEQVDVQVEDTSCTEFYEKIYESEEESDTTVMGISLTNITGSVTTESHVEVETISPQEFYNNTSEVIDNEGESDVEVKEISSEEIYSTTIEEMMTSGTVESTETVTSESNTTGDVESVPNMTNDSVQRRCGFFSAFHEYCVGRTESLTTEELVSRVQKDKDSALNWTTEEVNNIREELLSALPDMSLVLGRGKQQFSPHLSLPG